MLSSSLPAGSAASIRMAQARALRRELVRYS